MDLLGLDWNYAIYDAKFEMQKKGRGE